MATTAAVSAAPVGRPQLLFVDGSFEDLAQEMADYLQIGDDVRPLLEKAQKEDVLSQLVGASATLNTMPEKEFTAAANLMIHLVLQSADPKKLLPTLCSNFAKPLTASPVHGTGLGLNALTTVFNLLDPVNPVRARVFMTIVKFFRQHSMFDNLRPYLERLPSWFELWETPAEFQRETYEEVAQAAADVGEEEQSYQYVLKALRTFSDDDISSEAAQKLSLRAVRTAMLSPTHNQFSDLLALPSIQALRDTHQQWSELLDILAKRDLEDYNDFKEENEGFVDQNLDDAKLTRKMRLLTFASLAAATPSRELEYDAIIKALQIPTEEVEMWAIDVIRAGLVEGKLSQQRRTFLVHKVTYRVFSEKQYRELSTRIDQWRSTLANVLRVINQEQTNAREQRDGQETQHAEGGGFHGGGSRGAKRPYGGRGNHRGQGQQRERADNDD
jgi:translation initiation factor 3 subunit M